MNQALERIAEINSAAAGIMEETAARKAAMEKDFALRTQELDGQIRRDTEEKLASLKAALLERSGQRLSLEEQQARRKIQALEKTFRDKKEDILRSLLKEVLGEEGHGESSDL